MFTAGVQYSSTPAAVSVIHRPDGCAEYRLTQNVQNVEDPDNGTVITADEVYFEIPADQPKPTLEAVTEDFELYWGNGTGWPQRDPTPEERIAALETDNLTALEAVAELYEMMMP